MQIETRKGFLLGWTTGLAQHWVRQPVLQALGRVREVNDRAGLRRPLLGLRQRGPARQQL